MRKLSTFLLFLIPLGALGQNSLYTNFCVSGAQQALTSGLASSNYLEGVAPQCLVTVFLTGTQTLATIYSNGSSTPLTNPFQANLNGQWLFYAAESQSYDCMFSGGIGPNIISTPVTITGCFGGGGGGGTPPLPGGAPVSLSGGPGGTSQTLQAAGGPFNPSLSTTSSDNSALLNSWNGYPLLIPAGEFAFTNPVVISNVSSTTLQGTGWGGGNGALGATYKTDLNFIGVSGITFQCPGGSCVNNDIENLNINGDATPGTTGLSVLPPTNAMNQFTPDRLGIYGFCRATYFGEVGNISGGTLITNGSTCSTGLFVNQWGGSATAQAGGANSIVFKRITGTGGSNEATAQNYGLGFLNLVGEIGIDVTLGDVANTGTIAQCGGYITSGGAEGAWNVGSVGGSFTSDAVTATIHILNADALIYGPYGTVGPNSVCDFDYSGSESNMNYLGPTFQYAGGSRGKIRARAGANEEPPAMPTPVQAAGSSSYVHGQNVFYWWQAENWALALNGITVEMHSGFSNVASVTISADGNTVSFTPLISPLGTSPQPIGTVINATCYNVWRNTTNTPATATEIASCVTGTYVSNGAETAGTGTYYGNIPLVYQGHNSQVSAACPLQAQPQLAANPFQFQMIDEKGAYSNICNAAHELPSTATVTAEPAQENLHTYQPAPANVNGTNAEWVQKTTTVAYPLTAAANASAGSTVYTATGATSATCPGTVPYPQAVVLGDTVNLGNNGTFACTASASGTITLSNPNGIADTFTGTAGLQTSQLENIFVPPSYTPPIQVTPQVTPVTATLAFGTDATMLVSPTDNGATPVTSFTYSSPLGVGSTIFTIQAGPYSLPANYMEFTTGGSPPIVFPVGTTTPVKLYNGCSAYFQLFNVSGTGPYFSYLNQNCLPVTAGAPTAGQAACIKSYSNGQTVIGTCSTVVSSSGSCTCN